MRRFRNHASALALMVPLSLALAAAACDSATGPKFPDPVEEEEEDSVIEEGMRRTLGAVRSAAYEAATVALVPSFQPVGAR